MNPQEISSTVVVRIALSLSLVFLASLYLIKGTMTLIAAQAAERQFVDQIPKHLPIKVKIKKEKEKAIKDLSNEKWVRDFQLEITNTGSKPIYFLKMLLLMPGVTASDGIGMSFSIHYGSIALGPINYKARPEDVPLQPGETYVFNFSDPEVEGWERFRQRENHPDAKKLILVFQILSFGDGTGFFRTDGLSVPQGPGSKSSLNGCEPEPNLNGSSGVEGQHASRRRWPAIVPANDLPAGFLLANFLSTDSSQRASLNLELQSQQCCSGNDCFRSVPTLENCSCGGPLTGIQSTFCSDPRGSCNSYSPSGRFYFIPHCCAGMAV
jgi:hypothetical protein